jgi:activator of HSP90 ATPase
MKFTIKTTINTSAKNIYDAWLSSDGHSNMTGGEATASKSIGDEFTAWDGYITGKNIELEENERIVQSWRSTEFDAADEDSLIEVLLAENNGITELTLHHSNLPEGEDHYKNGWDEHYFQPMKAFFEKK